MSGVGWLHKPSNGEIRPLPDIPAWGGTTYFKGKQLPLLPENVIACIEEVAGSEEYGGNCAALVRIQFPSGKALLFKEPLVEFPSDKMIAQILLVT